VDVAVGEGVDGSGYRFGTRTERGLVGSQLIFSPGLVIASASTILHWMR